MWTAAQCSELKAEFQTNKRHNKASETMSTENSVTLDCTIELKGLKFNSVNCTASGTTFECVQR